MTKRKEQEERKSTMLKEGNHKECSDTSKLLTLNELQSVQSLCFPDNALSFLFL